MSSLPFLDTATLSRVLPVADAVDALEAAFGSPSLPEAPLRSHVETSSGTLLTMPATGAYGTGVKLVTLTPANPGRGLPLIHGLYVLFSADTQAPEAAIDGAALTALRTGAVSGLATRHLALEHASRLVLFGAGTQARAHLDAMCAVRPVQRVTVVSRTRERAEALAALARERGLDAETGSSDAVADADLVCTCTTSSASLFDGSWLAEGTHVNAVGAYTPDARELDDETVRRGRIVVEDREAAMAEAGDLLIPIASGVIGPQDVCADLAEVVRGMRVRRSVADVTVFKSVGIAFEDLVVARAAVDRASA